MVISHIDIGYLVTLGRASQLSVYGYIGTLCATVREREGRGQAREEVEASVYGYTGTL